MNKIGDIIKQWRYEKKLTGSAVASEIGISQQFLNDVENGKKKLSTKVFLKLSEMMDGNFKEKFEDEFYIGSLPDRYKNNVSINKPVKVGNIDLNNPITEFKQIPIYDSISAGFGSCESCVIGHMPLPQTNGFIGDVIGIKVKGNSMEPDIKDGDTVLIKKGIMPENHEVGAFILNDEGLLKRYKRTDRGAIILSSDNKEYEPIVIVEEDNFVIVGKKVGVFNH